MNIEDFRNKLNIIKISRRFASEEEIQQTIKTQNAIRGSNEITIMAMEELSELIQRLSKTLRCDTKSDYDENRIRIIEEIADSIMAIKAVTEVFNISNEELKAAITVKTNRIQEKCYELMAIKQR